MVNPFGPATDKQLALINDIKAICSEVTPFIDNTKLAAHFWIAAHITSYVHECRLRAYAHETYMEIIDARRDW